eukprot:208985_1
MSVVITVIGFICTISIVIAVSINSYNHITTKRAHTPTPLSAYWFKTLSFLSIVAMLTWFLHALNITLNSMNIYPTTNIFCIWQSRLSTAVYHISRCSFYAILIIRLHVAFNNSVYQYNLTKILLPLFIIVASFFIFA